MSSSLKGTPKTVSSEQMMRDRALFLLLVICALAVAIH